MTIGGTKRAVIESAVIEGEPSIFSFENWFWYLKIFPKQIGISLFIVGISGWILYFISDNKIMNHLGTKQKR